MKEITLGSPARQGRDPPFVSNNVQVSLRPLTLECKTSLSQLPFSMLSTPTPLCSELTLSAYSQPSDSTHHSPHNISAFLFEGLSPEHYPLSRSLLDECEYSPLLHLPCEHNDYNAPLVSASLLQSTTLKHVALSIDQLPSHLQQFLLQQNIPLISRTPLHVSTLINELAAHPDQNFVYELVYNIQHGCSIGIMVHNSRIVVRTFHQPTSNPLSWTMPLLKSAMLDAFWDLLTTLHSQISVVQALG